jgi:Whi5 like
MGKRLTRPLWSQMTRVLQNRLALANVKVKHGWENLSLDSIEPKIELELKRKRPVSSCGPLSDTSSSTSDRFYAISNVDSSPLTAPLFSEDIGRSASTNGKRVKYQPQVRSRPASSSHNRTKVRTGSIRATSWKSNYHLPQSSPVYHNRHVNFGAVSHAPSLSFVSETSTIPDDNLLSHSEDDDEDLPTLSFQRSGRPSHVRSSTPRMPRTPSPDPVRSARLRSKPFDNNNSRRSTNNEEGADLLMFLAASPSPAQPRRHNAPSTPPPKSTPLPSSMMNTPGGSGAHFFGFGATTPGMGFNFADYVNVTPSPAQVPWRTPGPTKTPLAAREARRRLNFDTLLPPGASPSLGNPDVKVQGLGMELGGELVSSQ